MTPEERGWPPLNLRKPLRNQRPRQITPQQIDEIRQALANGATPQELAVRYRVTASTIRRYR
ncbi:hypothetical protein [Streptomyces murinus]|uniref:hypothetical protein n=1 Tax=Streptomyces murinus TaxID=33900 RepID=UPI0018F6AE3C|nr:hypothetical protein [Streptomyces murinus]